jgi:hypothetical protein
MMSMVVQPVIPALGRLRQEELEFNIVRPCLKNKRKKKRPGMWYTSVIAAFGRLWQ